MSIYRIKKPDLPMWTLIPAFMLLGALLIAVVFGIWALVAWLVMLLWNVIASYFAWKLITFWVAFAFVALITLVSRLFFGGRSSSN